MKILLTIKEYRERIIASVIEEMNKAVLPTADDYVKYKFITLLVEETLSYGIMFKDECNQFFFKVFGKDRNGRKLTEGGIKRMTVAECDEFNSQEWYKKYYEEEIRRWHPISKMRTFRNDSCFMFEVYNILLLPFTKDINTKYHLVLEIFEKLYGHPFKYKED